MRKLALLGEQYEQSIAEMLQKQSVRLITLDMWNTFDLIWFDLIYDIIFIIEYLDSSRWSSRTWRASIERTTSARIRAFNCVSK